MPSIFMFESPPLEYTTHGCSGKMKCNNLGAYHSKYIWFNDSTIWSFGCNEIFRFLFFFPNSVSLVDENGGDSLVVNVDFCPHLQIKCCIISSRWRLCFTFDFHVMNVECTCLEAIIVCADSFFRVNRRNSLACSQLSVYFIRSSSTFFFLVIKKCFKYTWLCEKERICDGDGGSGGAKFGIISYNHLSNKQFQIRLNTIFLYVLISPFFFFPFACLQVAIYFHLYIDIFFTYFQNTITK